MTLELLAEIAKAQGTTVAAIVRDLNGLALQIRADHAYRNWEKFTNDLKATSAAASMPSIAAQLGYVPPPT